MADKNNGSTTTTPLVTGIVPAPADGSTVPSVVPVPDVTWDVNPASKRKNGRELSDVWSYLTAATDGVSPQHQKVTPCTHCHNPVNHHHKVERVKAHLLSCPDFKKVMMAKEVADRPDWYSGKKLFEPSPQSVSRSESSMSQTSQTSSMASYVLPKLKPPDQDRIDFHTAMHFYLTGTPFCRVEESHLLAAFKVARPDVKLPNQKQLAGKLLDDCYDYVKNQSNMQLRNTSTMHCLTTDATTNVNNASIINYMLISPDRSLFLECKNTEDKSHTAEYIANDL